MDYGDCTTMRTSMECAPDISIYGVRHKLACRCGANCYYDPQPCTCEFDPAYCACDEGPHPTWVTADDVEMPVCTMTNQHLNNAIRYLTRMLREAYSSGYEMAPNGMDIVIGNDVAQMEVSLAGLTAERDRRKHKLPEVKAALTYFAIPIPTDFDVQYLAELG